MIKEINKTNHLSILLVNIFRKSNILYLIENVKDFCTILVHLEVRSTFLPNDKKKNFANQTLLK